MVTMGLQIAGYQVSNTEITALSDQIVTAITQIVQIAGALMALYGRLTAEKKIG